MKLLKPQAGMTLIEIMVAVSILSVIMVSVVMLSNNMNKQLKDGERRGDIESLSRAIQQTISNKDNCSVSFLGAQAAVGSTTILTGLKTLSNNGAIINNQSLTVRAINSSDKFNATTINGMYLENKSNMGTGANYELVVTFVKNPQAIPGMSKAQSQGNVAGQNVVVRRFPVILDNCSRTVVTAAYPAQPTCANPIGSVMTVTSNNPSATDVFNVVVCRQCATRVPVKGCM